MDYITLKSGNAVATVQTLGGELISFKDKKGQERLWHGDPAVWPGHAPVLFPVIGSLKDNQTIIDGKAYTLQKHGFAKRMTFKVGKRGDDFVEMLLEANAETRNEFPFDFALHITHTITEDGFTTVYLVENRSEKIMPFCIGGHPGIRCPMEEGAAFEDYQLVFPTAEEAENALAPNGYLITGTQKLDCLLEDRILPLKYELFDAHDALILSHLKSREVKLVHKTTGKGISFSFPKFPVLGIWTMPFKRGKYLCLEPWQGMPGCVGETGKLEDKPYSVKLQPGRAYKTWYELAFID
ncbi:MAG: aldose 1-epimerase family protein [Clostridia bacterium]|nr:aldose 1-epimerase family protein [Clostridia bacterium]